MRRWIFLTLTVWTTFSVRGELQWFTDFEAAQGTARRENKAVLLDFTGSDWCGWCMKLKSEVFDQPEFAAFANANLVLVEVDFPRHKALSPELAEANNRLAQTYRIQGFPTIILLDKDGQLIGHAGYMEGGPPAFDANLARILKVDSQVTTPPAEVEKPKPAPKPSNVIAASKLIPIHYGALKLKAISGTKQRRLALINDQVLMVGDTANVKTDGKQVKVCCKEIRDSSVLITVDDKSMELTLGNQ